MRSEECIWKSPNPMHCSAFPGIMRAPTLSAALPSLPKTTALCLKTNISTKICSVSSLISHALQHISGQHARPDAQCCFARYVDSGLLFAASTDAPVKINALHRCAVALMQCTAAIFTAKWMPHSSCNFVNHAESSPVSQQIHL